ncbi:MAG: hypothetical protein K0T99_02040 [Alphaproteobacteria bacterium]|nr:hypothetical protein [Alphaproteobacteria bacterium]
MSFYDTNSDSDQGILTLEDQCAFDLTSYEVSTDKGHQEYLRSAKEKHEDESAIFTIVVLAALSSLFVIDRI